MNTQLVLDAIEHAIWTRSCEGITDLSGLIDHHDRGAQYTSIAYTERLSGAGIDASIGTTGDSYDCPRRDDQRPLQDRADQTQRAMAHRRPRRDRHPGMGRLVQPPTPLPTLRRHPASRTRGCVLPSRRSSANRRVLKQVSLRTRRQDSPPRLATSLRNQSNAPWPSSSPPPSHSLRTPANSSTTERLTPSLPHSPSLVPRPWP